MTEQPADYALRCENCARFQPVSMLKRVATPTCGRSGHSIALERAADRAGDPGACGPAGRFFEAHE